MRQCTFDSYDIIEQSACLTQASKYYIALIAASMICNGNCIAACRVSVNAPLYLLPQLRQRAFSCAGLTVTKLRNRLTSEHMEVINFLQMSDDVLQIGLSVRVFLCIFLSALADDFASLHSAHFVSLPNFGFEILDATFVIRIRFGIS